MSAALLKLKSKLLAILRLLLLEGRVLFYAKSAASVSETGENYFLYIFLKKNVLRGIVIQNFPRNLSSLFFSWIIFGGGLGEGGTPGGGGATIHLTAMCILLALKIAKSNGL